MLEKILQKRKDGENACQVFLGAFIHKQKWWLFSFFFNLVSFYGKKVLRFLSCLFTICNLAKCDIKHTKTFVPVFFAREKEIQQNQTQVKLIEVHGQVQGISDPVDEEWIYGIVVPDSMVCAYLGTGWSCTWHSFICCFIVNWNLCAVKRSLG